MRYFIAALLARPAGLEKLPFFLLTALVFGLLGILHSTLWLLGAMGVLVIAGALSLNPRFRKAIDSRRYDVSTPSAEEEYERLSAQIKVETRSRLRILERKRERILERQQEGGIDNFTLDANRYALQELLRVFAKLLLARQQLLTEDFATSIEKTQAEIESTQAALQGASQAQSTSQSATLGLQQERLKSLTQRQQKVAEIESDLKRIEAHFELALSESSMREKPQGIATDIGLISEGLHEDTSRNLESTITSTASQVAH